MRFSRLIADISEVKEMPVRIEFIVNWLRINGFQDEIRFYPVETDYKIAPAWFRRKKEIQAPYGEAKRVTEIFYSSKHNECWRRLFVCKELMHFFDSENQCTGNDEEAINVLIKDLLRSNSTSHADVSELDLKLCPQAEADNMAFMKALLCLAPGHIIDDLIAGSVLESKTLNELAHFLKIPEVFIENTLSDRFLITHSSVKFEIPLIYPQEAMK